MLPCDGITIRLPEALYTAETMCVAFVHVPDTSAPPAAIRAPIMGADALLWSRMNAHPDGIVMPVGVKPSRNAAQKIRSPAACVGNVMESAAALVAATNEIVTVSPPVTAQTRLQRPVHRLPEY